MSNASYIKLKNKIEKLNKDIDILIQHPGSREATLIKAQRGFKPPFVNSTAFIDNINKNC